MGLRVQVLSMSIRIPGGSVCEGVWIAAWVAVVGECVRRNENGVHGAAECAMAGGAE
jgi:hypothetical protein